MCEKQDALAAVHNHSAPLRPSLLIGPSGVLQLTRTHSQPAPEDTVIVFKPASGSLSPLTSAFAIGRTTLYPADAQYGVRKTVTVKVRGPSHISVSQLYGIL